MGAATSGLNGSTRIECATEQKGGGITPGRSTKNCAWLRPRADPQIFFPRCLGSRFVTSVVWRPGGITGKPKGRKQTLENAIAANCQFLKQKIAHGSARGLEFFFLPWNHSSCKLPKTKSRSEHTHVHQPNCRKPNQIADSFKLQRPWWRGRRGRNTGGRGSVGRGCNVLAAAKAQGQRDVGAVVGWWSSQTRGSTLNSRFTLKCPAPGNSPALEGTS
jgi:hypothetical protein